MKIKIIFLLSLFNLGLFSQSFGEVKSYSLDKNKSKVGFSVKHKITNDVYGIFEIVSGKVEYDVSNDKLVRVNASISTDSINTNNKRRDRHLKSKDFFYSSNFPSINFVSTKILLKDNNNYEVEGNLTMRGVTKPISLKGFKLKTDNDNLKFKASTMINRLDFDIKWNRPFQKIAGMLVSNDVRIILDVTFK